MPPLPHTGNACVLARTRMHAAPHAHTRECTRLHVCLQDFAGRLCAHPWHRLAADPAPPERGGAAAV